MFTQEKTIKELTEDIFTKNPGSLDLKFEEYSKISERLRSDANKAVNRLVEFERRVFCEKANRSGNLKQPYIYDEFDQMNETFLLSGLGGTDANGRKIVTFITLKDALQDMEEKREQAKSNLEEIEDNLTRIRLENIIDSYEERQKNTEI